MVDFTLTARQEELRGIARRYAVEVMIPAAEKADRIPEPDKSFDWDVIRKGSERGLRTLSVPKEFGGDGADVLTLAIVGETLAYGDLGIAVAFDQTWKILTTIVHMTNEDQRRRWLPRVMEDDTCLLGTGWTEPTAGSDNILPNPDPGVGMQMYAERRGDRWVLNGTKRYISNGGIAKIYLMIARTDRSAPLMTSLSAFLVPADAKGFTVPEVWDKMGQRCVQNGTLQFDDVEVPDADRVGEVGGALPMLGNFLINFGSNIQAGASVLGVAQRAYELSLQYAHARIQGSGPLFRHQLQQCRLARMAMKIEAARSYIWRSAWSTRLAEMDRKNAMLCKVFAAESAVEVCREAMEIWGAAGYMRKNPIEKLMRDALSFLHSDGTNDVLTLKAAGFLEDPAGSDDLGYHERTAEAAAGR
ncbi:MAG: acyl-CoA dehydrogenase family protein [bacterium]